MNELQIYAYSFLAEDVEASKWNGWCNRNVMTGRALI